jgi:hypothetical protein
VGNRLSPIPLRLGPLAPPGFAVRRSGLRWLREDGALCRAGEAVAYCNVGILPILGASRRFEEAFKDEFQDLQAALAPRVAGRIRRSEISSRGGFLDRLDLFQFWSADFVIGHLEPAEDAGPGLPGEEDELDILFMTGRRQANISEGRQGLLTGWHSRTRAWRPRDGAPPGAVLGLGVCELDGVLGGESSAFLELFEAIGGPAHAVHAHQEPLVPTARILVEQIRRTEAEYAAIVADLMGYLLKASPPALPEEWIFAAALLRGLGRKPLSDSYDLLSRTDVHRSGPVDAVLLTANAESQQLLRHRRLGYTLRIHEHRMWYAGRAVAAWIKDSFEPFAHGLDDMAHDYRELIGLIRAAPGRMPAHMLVFNRVSSLGDDDVQTYLGFDKPMSATLTSIYAKDLNLMLHDLARGHDVAIVDVDAITAEMGGQRNMPDAIHGSGALYAEVRAEVVHILRGKGVPGFGPALG